MDWLKAYEANFSRAKTLETAGLTEVAVLTPRLENATEKTRESAPPLIKQIWNFLEEQLEVAEGREMTVG